MNTQIVLRYSWDTFTIYFLTYYIFLTYILNWRKHLAIRHLDSNWILQVCLPTMPYEESVLLQKANWKIGNHKEDTRRLSADLQKKSSLLSSFIDMAAGQSRRYFTVYGPDTLPLSTHWSDDKHIGLSDSIQPVYLSAFTIEWIKGVDTELNIWRLPANTTLMYCIWSVYDRPIGGCFFSLFFVGEHCRFVVSQLHPTF